MTMSFLPTDGFDQFYGSGTPDGDPLWSSPNVSSTHGATSLPLIPGKLERPAIDSSAVQPRLLELLDRSAINHTCTLILGRAGTGKTLLAARFAEVKDRTAWYSIDATDTSWATFSLHFRELIRSRAGCGDVNSGINRIVCRTPLEMFADVTAQLELASCEWPRLIVLDGIHHLFDDVWFPEFFDLLIASIPRTTHVMMLSRSKPPNPLWRLRSKQVLNVIDEKLLAFSSNETEDLFVSYGLSRDEGKRAHSESYGRAGMLIKLLEARRNHTAN